MPEAPDTQPPNALETLEVARLQAGARQTDWARRLGITQGHYSKVSKGKARPSQSLLDRAAEIGGGLPSSEFEAQLLAAARSNPQFQQLLRLLLDMHLHAGHRPGQ